METQKSPLKQIAINYGMLLALLSIVVLVLMYVFNLEQDWKVSVVVSVVSIILFVKAIKTLKVEQQGYISVGEAIKVGLATAAISGIIGAIYTYLHYNFVYPEFIEIAIENARNQILEGNPDMPQEQYDMAIGMAEKFTSPGMMATFSLIGSLFFGFIISVITGLIIQNKRPENY